MAHRVHHPYWHGMLTNRAQTNSVGRSSGPHVQGVLNLADNRSEDGGTLLVPGFHRSFEPWFEALGEIDDNTTEGGAWGWVVRRKQGGGSFKFSQRDPIHGLACGDFDIILVHPPCVL